MSENQIHVISASIIKVESTAQINLPPWDLELLFLEYGQRGLLFLNPTSVQETTIVAKTGATSLIDHLKASLERTLHFFPPLTGHLATTTSDGGAGTCFSVDCSSNRDGEGGGGGALFVHATVQDTNLAVADVVDSPEVRKYDGVSRPPSGGAGGWVVHRLQH